MSDFKIGDIVFHEHNMKFGLVKGIDDERYNHPSVLIQAINIGQHKWNNPSYLGRDDIQWYKKNISMANNKEVYQWEEENSKTEI